MSVAKTFDLKFLAQIFAVPVVMGGLGYYPLMKYGTEQIVNGVIAGVVLSLVNVLIGYVVIQFSLNKSYTTFIQIVLGGIVLRLFVMVGLLLICVGLLKLHSISVVGSLFVMYIIFLTMEVLYIHKKVQNS
ncbi:MAG: hypothetical protein WCT42_04410 [Candidatus Paceibacterota bacterium]